MDKQRTDPAESDCTPLYEIQQPPEKSPEQKPLTLLDVSELFIVKKSIPGSCNSQNSANSATTSKNTDSSDGDIIILHSTRKGNSYAAQNKEKARSESKNRNHPNKNKGSRILDEVAMKNESSNLLKSKDSSHNDDIISVKVIRQDAVHRAADTKSKRKDVLDNDIKIVDDVTVEKESCSPEPETKSKILEEDDDIILDAIVLKMIKKRNTPVSISQEEDTVDNNNTRLLDEKDFQGGCRNLPQSMSEDKDVPSNDALDVLDKVPRLDQYRKSGCSKSKDRHILKNDIKILTVSSITSKEYNRVPECKAENKCNEDKIMLKIGITENNSSISQESMFLENSKNYIDIQNDNENMIQRCNLPVAKEIKSSVKLNMKDGKSFIRQVGHFSVKPKHEVKQSPENSISCNNEIGYSSNRSKCVSEESSSYKNKTVSSKINCSFIGKNEKIQNEVSVTRKEYSWSPKSQKQSIPFYEEIILDADITTNNTPSSPESNFTQNSKNYSSVQWKNVNKVQFCNLPVFKETNCDVESTTKDRNSFNGKVGHSSEIQSGEVGKSSIKEVSHNNKAPKSNESLTKKSNSFHYVKDIVSNSFDSFEKKEECKKNENEIPTIGKEYNLSPESKTQHKSIPFDDEIILDANITENNPPSSQELIFVQNSKNCIDVKSGDENKTQVCNFRITKEVKSGVKNLKKYGKTCIDNVRHSSAIRKCEIRQSPIKDVSCYNKVGYSSKRSKSLTEDSNVFNSFKNKNDSRKMNCSLFGKKEKSQQNQDGFSVPSLIQKGEVRQSPIKDVGCNNAVGYSSKRNKSPTEESNFCNSFKDKNVSRKANRSLFGKKEKSQQNQNGFSVPLKEYNSVHDEIILNVDIAEKKPPNSQKSVFAQNSKHDIDIQGENQNKIQYCSFPVVKKRKIGVKPTLKDGMNLNSEVRHSSVIQKCEVGQTSIKAVSSNNEVGYSTKENKSLTEELNCCNSFKNRSISRDMNSSLFAKKESKKNQNGFPSTIKKNNLPPKSKAQNIHFASFDDELIMDVDKTENNNHTSKEPSFAHNSKYRIDIQDENQNGVQCFKLSDVTKINSSVKPITRGRKNFTCKVKHSSMDKKCEIVQSSIKAVSCNNKEWNSFKKNKSLTEESNSSNSNKVKSYSKNGSCSLLVENVGSKKNQASCSASNTMSQDSDSDFDSVHKCVWCSFATPDIEVIEKHMEEKHNTSEKRKCPFCDLRPTYGDIFNHIESHLDEPPYFCQQCPYSTESVYFFVSHLTCHKNNKNTSLKKFHCENCSFSTDIRVEFSEHTAVHIPDYEVIRKQGKPFSCKVCNKIFFDKMRLGQHQKIHKKERKNSKKSAETNHHLFQCKSCDFSAGRETIFKRHQVVHHPEK